jgi:hypothetical protein
MYQVLVSRASAKITRIGVTALRPRFSPPTQLHLKSGQDARYLPVAHFSVLLVALVTFLM